MSDRPFMFVVKQTFKEWKGYLQKLTAEAGLPDSYRHILMYLARNPGVSQKELAADAQITYAAISHTIKEMQLKGFITKEADETDQRYTKLYLTEKGISSADKIREKIHEADRIITSILTPEKEDEVIEVLDMIRDAIRKKL